MIYQDLRDFIEQLEEKSLLKRIDYPISPKLEMTAVSDKVLQAGGPALLFTNKQMLSMPVLTNLFGTVERVALGMGAESIEALRELGKLLAYLKEPEPPKGFKDALAKFPLVKAAYNMAPKHVSKGACQEIIYEGEQVDLNQIPVQTCWPKDAAPLITWGFIDNKFYPKTN